MQQADRRHGIPVFCEYGRVCRMRRNMNIIEVEHLKKYYGEVKAVDDISFTVKEGEFFSFLGVNGAGKSTTISVLCGKEGRTAGSVRIAGEDVSRCLEKVKRSLGVVFQESGLDRSLTVRDNLAYRAALYGISGRAFSARLGELCALFDLGDLLGRPLGKLSGGQRRRVDVARALVHSPKLLILDEPTTGLDPQTRRSLWETLGRLRKVRGMTVFLTTHYMEEAAESDHVVILDGGKIKADDTPLGLKERYTGDFIALYHVREEDVRKLNLPYERTGEGYRICVSDTDAAARLIRENSFITDFEVTKGKMDDVFLAVTGKTTE